MCVLHESMHGTAACRTFGAAAGRCDGPLAPGPRHTAVSARLRPAKYVIPKSDLQVTNQLAGCLVAAFRSSNVRRTVFCQTELNSASDAL